MEGNPLQVPPPQILQEGTKAAIAYLRERMQCTWFGGDDRIHSLSALILYLLPTAPALPQEREWLSLVDEDYRIEGNTFRLWCYNGMKARGILAGTLTTDLCSVGRVVCDS